MKRLLFKLYFYFLMFGIDPRKTINSLKGMKKYFLDLQILRDQQKNSLKIFPFGRSYPCLDDWFTESGTANGHYFHQDLLVARRIHKNLPTYHADIGSRIDGFVAHIASFRCIDVIDIRPLSLNIPNIKFIQADLMGPVNIQLIEYYDSISCLHALEHFGLGRYGDPINYDGYLIGLSNLYKMLKRNGKLYLSVPIGPQRIEFNAHRVFSVNYILECLKDKFTLDHFSFVDDEGNLHENVSLSASNLNNNFGCIYGCGIFEVTKI